ncbi:Corticotropin-releasing factor-binding protein [Orchesella cincta]|uniref:Corticotropin-releasing factor-binding protein n=1 Tax=Orchesella cincta TaxID=48709 RepID=A0A1D2NM92_ORCCI|nr:Corticotropin-releasing factor-binding protein [Orchesella cincta]
MADCVKITLDEGIFHYKSRGSSRTCGLYLISDPNKLIVVTIEYLDVLCQGGGLISVVDGWELNGAVFPSYEDHEKSISSRFHDLCVDTKRHPIKRIFASSQNAALIQYRIPMFGQGFSVRVEHIPNPRPCNVLVQDTEGIFTLENYGRNVNCSVMTIFDAKIRIMYMNTGLHRSGVKTFSHSPRLQKGIYHKCAKMGMEDFVQIGGSSGLDTTKMETIDEVCGYQPHALSKSMTIFCGMTTIRLVSSGKHSNKVVVEVLKATIDDLDSANYMCDLGLGGYK